VPKNEGEGRVGARLEVLGGGVGEVRGGSQSGDNL